MAPIPHIRGAGALANVKIQGTYGTSETAAAYSLRVESVEVSTGANRSQIRALGQGSKGFAGPTFVESQTASFTARIVAHYTVDGLATLLRWILWGTWGTTGSGPYTHALTTAGTRLGATMRFNTGTVVAGNVGSPGRYNYTVHGDAVNEAAQHHALQTRVSARHRANIQDAASGEATRSEFKKSLK